MNQRVVCAACGHVGTKKTITGSDILVTVLLGLLFIIPGILHVMNVQNTINSCEKCGQKALIPTDSPKGKELLSAGRQRSAKA